MLVRKIDVEYRDGEDVRRMPSCFLWDEESDFVYVTHGMLCALFSNRYRKLEVRGSEGVKVGETQSQCVTHFQFVKKMLSKGCEASGRTVKIVRVRELRRDRHTIKSQKIAGRTAEWCRLFWEEDGGGVREENVDCVRVLLKELNSAYWEHVSSFLLGDCMGVRHRKGFFDE